MMKNIPVHKLTDRISTGLEIQTTGNGNLKREGDIMGAHRDDHYLFFFLEKGAGTLMIDFTEIEITERSVYYILPGQVHHRINDNNTEGWFMAVDSLLIPSDLRAVFEDHLLIQQPYTLNEIQYQQCKKLVGLLHEKYLEDAGGPFYLQIVHSLLKSYLGIIACCYNYDRSAYAQATRPQQIAQAFKKLLVEHLRVMKNPSAYAERLHISESYLNESLKRVTGFPVSYWILSEIILEAKRLLYYSSMNVKEIAHDLGYEDHTYFSRLFKKTAGLTPLSFREFYRK